MIRDLFMSTGAWNVTLRADTPMSVRNALGEKDTVIFMPGRIAGTAGGASQVSAADMLALSMFTGRLDRQTMAPFGERCLMSGPSIVAWMGDSSGKGPYYGPGYSGSTTMGIRLIAYFVTVAYTGGITLGSTTGISANNFTDTAVAYGETVRTAFDRWCGLTTVPTQWKVSPAGVMDFTPSGTYTIFNGDSKVLVGRGLKAERRSDLTVIPFESLTVETDYSESTTNVWATDGAGNYEVSAGAATAGKTFDGVHTPVINVMDRLSTNPTTADLQLYADHRAADVYVPRSRYQMTLPADALLADVLDPGGRFYLWDPILNQTGSATIIANGKQIQPTLLRCTGISYPVTKGMGVYGWAHWTNSGAFVDLSPWIDYDAEPRATTVDVGPPPSGLTRNVRRAIQ